MNNNILWLYNSGEQPKNAIQTAAIATKLLWQIMMYRHSKT